jgi:hypothetical protein
VVSTGLGVWASLSATAADVTPESVTSGTLKLALADSGAGFTQAVSGLAPKDVVNRYLTVTNSGTLDATALVLNATTSVNNALVTDGTTTKGLRVTVSSCSVAWTASTGVCGGTTTPVATGVALSSLASSTTPITVVSGAVPAGAVQNLQVSLTLPDQTETTVNGVVPTANTVQGLSTAITWTFSESQRTGATTSS